MHHSAAEHEAGVLQRDDQRAWVVPPQHGEANARPDAHLGETMLQAPTGPGADELDLLPRRHNRKGYS